MGSFSLLYGFHMAVIRFSYEFDMDFIWFSYLFHTVGIPEPYLRYAGGILLPYCFHTEIIHSAYMNHTLTIHSRLKCKRRVEEKNVISLKEFRWQRMFFQKLHSFLVLLPEIGRFRVARDFFAFRFFNGGFSRFDIFFIVGHRLLQI